MDDPDGYGWRDLLEDLRAGEYDDLAWVLVGWTLFVFALGYLAGGLL